MQPWTPDVELTEDIARRLIEGRFPQLDVRSIQRIGEGWDNAAYLINSEIVFRLPHRKQGAALMETECAVLAYLNSHDPPISIPSPVYVAAPGSDYRYPFAGYPLIPGNTADGESWTDDARAATAEPLGKFLSWLHEIPTDVPFALGDELRRADLTYRLPIVLERVKNAPSGFLPLLEELAGTPSLASPPLWVHGDLYSRHLVADPGQQIVGVIDWGDAHVGDPALDLAIAWMFLPSSAHEAFMRAYGHIEPDTWRRARFRAMTHWIYLSGYAEATNDECLRRELEFLLKNVMVS